jgi:hypothetical protein
VLGFLVSAVTAVAGPVDSFDDITFWVGSGSQSSALAIDWVEGNADESLVWGYRYDGSKTSEDKLRAILAADPFPVFIRHRGVWHWLRRRQGWIRAH